MLLIFDIILSLLSVGIILVDFYFFPIPRFISLVFILLLLFLVILQLIKSKRLRSKILFSVINICVIGFVFLGTYCNPYKNSIFGYINNYDEGCSKAYNTKLTYQEAKSDLDSAINHLRNVHPMFINGLTDDIKILYNQAIINLQKNKNISVNDLRREIEVIYGSLGDGHTEIYGWYNDPHYLKYKHNHNLVKDEIVAVNGITIEEIFNANRQCFSFETEKYGILDVKSCLQTLEDLDYLGFNVDTGITYTYINIKGEEFQETYYRDDFLTIDKYMIYNNIDNYNTNNDINEFVRYEIMPEKNLVVLTLDQCIYNDYYKKCLADMFKKVKEQGISNVCVDVRNNSGGASVVINEFLRYINVDSYDGPRSDIRCGIYMKHVTEKDLERETKYAKLFSKEYRELLSKCEDLLFDGNIYILTSTYSYSSAMQFAMYICDNHIGTVIGEAPGNKARSYGDTVKFKLKNSDLTLSISFKKWYRIDESNTDEFVEPDIQCKSEDALEVLIENLSGK